MNIAILGSGGREHALCYKLKQSPMIKQIFCIPGNAGTKSIAKNIEENIAPIDIALLNAAAYSPNKSQQFNINNYNLLK